LDRLYAFIGKKLVAKQKVICKTIKRKLITGEEARRYVLRLVFGIDSLRSKFSKKYGRL
jgi:hypothetical protein